MSDIRFPNESAAYRAARDDLLAAEIALRRQVEAVAAQRRALPAGGAVPTDYAFQGAGGIVRMSQLFGAHDTLALYGFMLPPGGPACPMCTSFLDSLDGAVDHATQRIALAVAAKAPFAEIAAFASGRGWRRLRLLSWGGSSFGPDYHAERDGGQMPMLNVFQRTPAGVVHRWGTEMLYAPSEPGQNARHMDMLWPLWNLLDTTPGGRGVDWYPALQY